MSKHNLDDLLTEEEAILFFMEQRGCDREEAEALFEQFKTARPHAFVESGDC